MVEPAFQQAREHRKRFAHGMGSEIETHLVHRAWLPLDRQGLEPAQRVLRSEIVGKRGPLFFYGRAEPSHSTALSQRDAALL